MCACARVEIGGVAGILVTASEPARKVLPLAERAAMLFGASSEPLAVFSADGALLCTNSDLAPGTTLEGLGANPSGSAAAATPCCSCCCRMKGRKLGRSKRPSKQRK